MKYKQYPNKQTTLSH